MSYRAKSLALLLALGIVGIVGLPQAHGADLRSPSHKEVIEVRLIASEPSLPLTSFGSNWMSYVAEMHSGDEPSQLVRFVYSHSRSAPTLPKSFLDYALVHQFDALRDEECDLPLASMLYSYKFSSDDYVPARPLGRELTLDYASNAPRLSERDDKVLPCYVVRPKDYRGSHAMNPIEKHQRKSADGF